MTQRQEFTVIRSYNGFELRQYLPCSIAEVKVSADYSSAGSLAFRSLFSYISQGNKKSEKIAMKTVDFGAALNAKRAKCK